MHAMCAIVGKTITDIYTLMERQCDIGLWDYSNIGGRYLNTIPISKNCQNQHPVDFPFLDERPEVNGFIGDPMANNLNCQYVSLTRIRNINKEECERLHLCNHLDILHPAAVLIKYLDNSISDLIEDRNMSHEMLMDLINNPRYKSFYIAVVDYHY